MSRDLASYLNNLDKIRLISEREVLSFPLEMSKRGGQLFQKCNEIPGDFPEVKFISKSLKSNQVWQSWLRRGNPRNCNVCVALRQGGNSRFSFGVGNKIERSLLFPNPKGFALGHEHGGSQPGQSCCFWGTLPWQIYFFPSAKMPPRRFYMHPLRFQGVQKWR